MKPTPEQILSALNEMIQSKTELKAEKVELALVDDLKDAAKFYNITLDMAMDVNDELENIARMMTATKATASKSEDVLKVIPKIEKQAKELGVNPDEIKGYKEAVRFSKYVIGIQKTIDKSISKLKGAKL